ncbi:hypothetical protein ACKS0A_03712 [Histoplasma ohiense]
MTVRNPSSVSFNARRPSSRTSHSHRLRAASHPFCCRRSEMKRPIVAIVPASYTDALDVEMYTKEDSAALSDVVDKLKKTRFCATACKEGTLEVVRRPRMSGIWDGQGFSGDTEDESPVWGTLISGDS